MVCKLGYKFARIERGRGADYRRLHQPAEGLGEDHQRYSDDPVGSVREGFQRNGWGREAVNTIWFTLAIQILKLLRWYFNQMSPEERTKFNELLEAWKKQIEEMEMPEPPSLEGR